MFERRGIFTLFAAAALAFALALPAAAQNVLPAGFTGHEIGDGSGTITDEGGKLTIQGEGEDLSGFDADSFFLVARQLNGNGTITARLLGATGGGGDGLERVGVMIREDLDIDSAFASTHLTNRNQGLEFVWREAKAENAQRESGYARRAFPIWLRVQRAGDQLSGYFSHDGQLWSPTTTQTVDMGESAQAGLFVVSREDDLVMTTEWDNVSVSEGNAQLQVHGLQACGSANGVALTWQAVPGAASYNVFRGAPGIEMGGVQLDQLVKINAAALTETSFADNSEQLQAGARQVYAVAAVMGDGSQGPLTSVTAGKAGPPLALPEGFTFSVFGEHPEGDCETGSIGALFDAATNTVTLRSGGNDFWEATNNHAVALTRRVTGNARITVTIPEVPLGVSTCCTKGGVILLESLAPAARHVMNTLRTDCLRTQYRLEEDGGSAEFGCLLAFDEIRDQLAKGPLFLRVERVGDDVTTFYSLDGTEFVEMDVSTIDGLANEVELGVALTARDRDAPILNRITQMRFQNITIEPID